MTLSPRTLKMGLIGSLALNLFLGGLFLGKVLRPEPKVAAAGTQTRFAAQGAVAAPSANSVPREPAAPIDEPVPTAKTSTRSVVPLRSEPTSKHAAMPDRHEGNGMDHGGRGPDGPSHGLRQIMGTLDPADQRILRTGLRQVMLQSRDDKRQVRQLRQEAAQIALESEFNQDKVSAAMARARTSELEGRARAEAILMETLSKLSPEGRQKVVPVLLLRKRDRIDPSAAEARHSHRD